MRLWSRGQPGLWPAQSSREAGGFASKLPHLVSAGGLISCHVGFPLGVLMVWLLVYSRVILLMVHLLMVTQTTL